MSGRGSSFEDDVYRTLIWRGDLIPRSEQEVEWAEDGERKRSSTGEEDVHNWPSADVLVSYDPKREQIRYTALSTGAVLHVHDLKRQSLWRRLLQQWTMWLRRFDG